MSFLKKEILHIEIDSVHPLLLPSIRQSVLACNAIFALAGLIYHNKCLWCADYNTSFKSKYGLGVKNQGKKKL